MYLLPGPRAINVIARAGYFAAEVKETDAQQTLYDAARCNPAVAS